MGVCLDYSRQLLSNGSVCVRSHSSDTAFCHGNLLILYLSDHFSENWGFMSLAPVIGSNILSIAFGRIFDAHTSTSIAPNRNLVSNAVANTSSSSLNTRSVPSDSHSLCLEGRACYADSLKLTIGACSLAFVLGVYVSYRDWKKMQKLDMDAERRERTGRIEEGWDEL